MIARLSTTMQARASRGQGSTNPQHGCCGTTKRWNCPPLREQSLWGKVVTIARESFGWKLLPLDAEALPQKVTAFTAYWISSERSVDPGGSIPGGPTPRMPR
jgi:hypothetical protein